MTKRSIPSVWRNQDGAALVEMTVVMPFLLVMAFGVYEFGNLLYGYQQVHTGVRDAARYMARVQNTAISLTPCVPPTVGSTTTNNVLLSKEVNAQDIAVMGEVGGTTKRVSWWDKPNISFTYTTIANPMISGYPSYRGPISGITIIKVTANPTYAGLGFMGALGLVTPTIKVEHSERCIGEG